MGQGGGGRDFQVKIGNEGKSYHNMVKKKVY